MTAAERMTRHLGEEQDIEKFYRHVTAKYTNLVKMAYSKHTCLQCGEEYKPLTNLQRRNCWMHTGVFRHSTGAWSCCNNPRDIIGCVSCMHTDSSAILVAMHNDPHNSYAELPQEALDFALVPFNPNIVEDFPEGSRSLEGRTGKFYHIRRVVV